MSESQSLNANAVDDPPPPYEPPGAASTVATTPTTQSAGGEVNTYHVYRTSFGNYNFILENRTFAFYVKARSIRVPDLTVHRGKGDYDREVASCDYPSYPNTYARLSILREINNRGTAILTRMAPDGSFTATLSGQNVDSGVEGSTPASIQRVFQWTRTPAQAGVLSSRRLVDKTTGEELAVLQNLGGASEKCFLLRSLAQYGVAFEVLVVTSAIALYDGQTRGRFPSSGNVSIPGPSLGYSGGFRARSRRSGWGVISAAAGGAAGGGGA